MKEKFSKGMWKKDKISNDDDFIKAGLGGMGYSCRLYKKTIPNCKFIICWFQNHN
jgi:hypothetical protein